jgi:hypothetical protein
MKTNRELFTALYTENLFKCVKLYPDEYCYTNDQVISVARKMETAIVSGCYNKEGRAIKMTCKQLGIKYTYTGINEYIKEQTK